MKTTLSRRAFLKRAGLLAACGGTMSGLSAQGGTGAPPNIVFILIDDFGWTDAGCYGSTFYDTPAIDRLAGMGMRFTDGYAACTVCSPTRASILTGKYPARLHLTDWIAGHVRPRAKLRIPDWTKHLPPEEVTLAEVLKEEGYATGFIGKWHLGPDETYWPLRQGFDVNVGGYHRGQPPSYFAPYRIPTMEEGPEGEYLTDRHAADAVAFVEANRERPFLLYLSMYAVHTPLQAKKEMVEAYARKAEGMPPGGQRNPVYAAMIRSMDECVGRVVDALDAKGLLKNTVIFFTGDNGGLIGNPQRPVTSNAPLRAGKGSAYEGGVREPFIVVWPGVTRPGSLCSVPVISVDVYPTILEITGARGVESHNADVDGVSLVPLLKGGQALPRSAVYWHYPHYHPGGATPYGAIRAGNEKLIEFYEDDRVELYDLARDIGETRDLAAEMPDRARELRAALHAWRERVGAQMPTANPAYADATAPGERPTTSAHGFAAVKDAELRPSEFGWELRSGGEGTALRKLATPFRKRVTIEAVMHTRRTRAEGWQNGFVAFGRTDRDADLFCAGIYIGRAALAVFRGPGAESPREAPAAEGFAGEEDIPVRVDIDAGRRTIVLTAAGSSVAMPLPEDVTEIGYAGYHVLRTETGFTELRVTGE